MTAWKRGVRDSVPIMLGYLPVAFSFGLTAVQAGLSPNLTILISVIVFAGGSQFVLVGLLATGASAPATIAAVLLMNARHVFYGATLSQFLARHTRLPRALLAFGLTDEVFASAMGKIANLDNMYEREYWLISIQMCAYSSWVAGTIIGAHVGHSLILHWPTIDQALVFVLPALFLSLLLSTDWRTQGIPMVVAGLVVLVSALSQIPTHFAILAGIIIGGLSGCVLRKDRRDV